MDRHVDSKDTSQAQARRNSLLLALTGPYSEPDARGCSSVRDPFAMRIGAIEVRSAYFVTRRSALCQHNDIVAMPKRTQGTGS